MEDTATFSVHWGPGWGPKTRQTEPPTHPLSGDHRNVAPSILRRVGMGKATGEGTDGELNK
jgi:hypothetical protein